MLSTTQAQFFREQGYLVVPGLLEGGLVEDAKKAADGEFARANDPTKRLAWDIMEPGDAAVYRLSKMLDRGPAFRSIALHPRVAEVIEGILGAHARVCTNRHNMLIAKAPRVGAGFCWHQDGFSWGHNNLVTLMVLLDEGTRENGCLQLVPGIHRGYLANNPTGTLQWGMNVEDTEVKDLVTQALPVEGRPGDAVFFHCLTPHFSAPNPSDRGRRSLSFAYVAARDQWLHHPQKDAIASLPLEE
jgi:ectoine hydroxylase-related dioxygenase (phytanoyl-CoA dioxygenase family)